VRAAWLSTSAPVESLTNRTGAGQQAEANHYCQLNDAVEAKVVAPEQRFRFHDLRAYYTTVHKRTRGELPDLHANPEVTARVYDRNREVPRKAL
jgi:integrase